MSNKPRITMRSKGNNKNYAVIDLLEDIEARERWKAARRAIKGYKKAIKRIIEKDDNRFDDYNVLQSLAHAAKDDKVIDALITLQDFVCRNELESIRRLKTFIAGKKRQCKRLKKDVPMLVYYRNNRAHCPYCRSIVNPDNRHCPTCGQRILGE